MTAPHFIDDPQPDDTIRPREHAYPWMDEQIASGAVRAVGLRVIDARDMLTLLGMRAEPIYHNNMIIGLSFGTPCKGKQARRRAKTRALFRRRVNTVIRLARRVAALPASCARSNYQHRCRRRVSRG